MFDPKYFLGMLVFIALVLIALGYMIGKEI